MLNWFGQHLAEEDRRTGGERGRAPGISQVAWGLAWRKWIDLTTARACDYFVDARTLVTARLASGCAAAPPVVGGSSLS